MLLFAPKPFSGIALVFAIFFFKGLLSISIRGLLPFISVGNVVGVLPPSFQLQPSWEDPQKHAGSSSVHIAHQFWDIFRVWMHLVLLPISRDGALRKEYVHPLQCCSSSLLSFKTYKGSTENPNLSTLLNVFLFISRSSC